MARGKIKTRDGVGGGTRRRPLMFVLIGCGSLLMLLLVALLAVKAGVRSWLEGAGFRTWLTERSAALLQSETELVGLAWQNREVTATSFRATGYPEAGFAQLDLQGVRAKPNGVINQRIQIPEITLQSLDLRFGQDRLPPPATSPNAETLSPSPEQAKVPGWLGRFLPTGVEVDEIKVASANILVERAKGEAVFALKGLDTTIQPDFSTQLWEFSGRGGEMLLPGRPPLDVDDLALRWKGSELFVDRCGLGIFKRGRIDGNGEIRFDEAGLFDLELEISAIDIKDLVEGDWRDRLQGTISGPIKITGPPGDLRYEGTLQVADAMVQSMGLLDQLARYTKAEQFKHLPLQTTSADFVKQGDRIELRNLVLQSDGLMRIEGSIDLDGDMIIGHLQAGVTPGTLRWIPGAEQKVFTEDRNGFRWSPLELSGTIHDPKENLSGALLLAAGEAVMEDLPRSLLDQANQLLNPEAPTPADPANPANPAAPAAPNSAVDAVIPAPAKEILDLFNPFGK
jgi:hypothetical protein